MHAEVYEYRREDAVVQELHVDGEFKFMFSTELGEELDSCTRIALLMERANLAGALGEKLLIKVIHGTPM